jgi:hypothetical protein
MAARMEEGTKKILGDLLRVGILGLSFDLVGREELPDSRKED